MAKRKLTKSVCARTILSAKRGGTITPAQANDLLNTMLNMAQQLANRRRIVLADAVREIAGEMKMTNRLNRAVQRRNMLLQYAKNQDITNWIKNTSYKKLGDAFGKYIDNTAMAGTALGNRLLKRFVLRLDADGVLDVWLSKNLPDADIYMEMDNISRVNAGGAIGPVRSISQNDAAYKIALALTALHDEIVTLKNQHGAYIPRSPGYMHTQTHNPEAIRAGGERGLLGWKKKNKDESYRIWRDWIDANTRIDWVRTLDGGDKDEFLKEFHNAIYDSTHVDDMDTLSEIIAFKTYGSLANKLSSRRVLWFDDWESAYKYNQAWGKRNFKEQIINQFMQAGRQIAILQRWGPNPDAQFKNVKNTLIAAAQRLREGSTEQIKSIERQSHLWKWEELTGRANVSVSPRLSRFTDNIKSVVVMGHAGKMVIPSMGGDQVLFASAGMYHGIRMVDILRMRTITALPPGPERQNLLKGTTFLANSVMSNMSHMYVHDVRPAMILERGTEMSMTLNFMKAHVDAHERAASEFGTWILGQKSDTEWNDLSDVDQRIFNEFEIGEAEWEAVRGKAYTLKDYGGDKVISLDLIENLDDADLVPVLHSKNLEITRPNLDRVKFEMVSKFGTWLTDFMHFATGRPTVATRAFMSMGMKRGTAMRELLNLFTIFKGFPITAWMNLVRQVKMHGVPKDGMPFLPWIASNKHLFSWGSMYAAGTMLAGAFAVTAADLVMGRNPKPWFNTATGKPIWSTIIQAFSRGGGIGIYGDLLFSEYDRNTRNMLDVMAGPALGQLTGFGRIYTLGAKMLTGDEVASEKAPYWMYRQLERNAPFVNLFYIKPLYDWMIGWSLREGLSPGVMRRHEANVERENMQSWWLSPSEAVRQDWNMADRFGQFFKEMENIEFDLAKDIRK